MAHSDQNPPVPTVDGAMLLRLRIGHGIDVHPFADPVAKPIPPANDNAEAPHSTAHPVTHCHLGGVPIPHSRSLRGHSDADVLLHALTDALLGAAGKPDIGHFFPDSDATLKGISSITLLSRAWKMLTDEGFSLLNLDCCVLAEAPRIAPYIPQMKAVISQALSISVDRISIKATTTERLGFVGREEGITATAVALLLAPKI